MSGGVDEALVFPDLFFRRGERIEGGVGPKLLKNLASGIAPVSLSCGPGGESLTEPEGIVSGGSAGGNSRCLVVNNMGQFMGHQFKEPFPAEEKPGTGRLQINGLFRGPGLEPAVAVPLDRPFQGIMIRADNDRDGVDKGSPYCNARQRPFDRFFNEGKSGDVRLLITDDDGEFRKGEGLHSLARWRWEEESAALCPKEQGKK